MLRTKRGTFFACATFFVFHIVTREIRLVLHAHEAQAHLQSDRPHDGIDASVHQSFQVVTVQVLISEVETY